MPIYSPTGFLDVTNATLRGSKIVTTSNVGVANLNPLNTLSVGSNLQVEDTGSNVLTVRGNAAAAAMTLGVITIAPSYSLEIVSNIGNTVSNTVQFTNDTTGFVTTANIEVGTGNLFVDTTTGEVTVGEQLTVTNRADVTDFHASNLTVASALYANAASGRVGVHTTNPGNFALDVHGSANVGALTATDVTVTGNLAVAGELTSIRSTTVNVDDPIIGLANNNTSDPAVLDIGFVMARPSTATGSNVAIIFDESSDTLEIGYTTGKHTDTTITIDDSALFHTNIHGNVAVSNLNIGQFSVVAAYGLDHVTNENNSTGDTIISTNGTTGLQTTTNVSVGRDALVSGNVEVSKELTVSGNVEVSKELTVSGNLEVGTANLFVDTTTGNVGVGTTTPGASLEVSGNVAVSSNLEVGTANLFVDTTTGNVGVGTTAPTESLDIVGNLNLQKVSNTATIKLNSNVVTEYTRSKKSLIKYPRVALGTNSTSYSGLSGGSTVNGYTIKASDEYNSDFVTSKAFTNTRLDDIDTWISGSSAYNSTTKLPVTNSATTTKFGQDGSWLEIKLPNAIQLHYIHVFSRNTHITERIDTADIWASNTGTDGDWVKLTTISFNADYTDTNPMVGNIDTWTYYQYFAIQITKIGWTGTYTNVGEWELYGVPEYDPDADGTDVIARSMPNVPNTDWLDVYWDGQDYTSMPGTVTDKTDNGNDGTPSGDVGFDTEYKAFTFDGNGDYISGTQGVGTGQPVHSQSVWFKLSSTTGDYQYISVIGTTNNNAQAGLIIKDDGTTLLGSFYGGDRTITQITQSRWYHAVLVYPGGTTDNANCYINGVEVPTGGSPGTPSLTGTDVYLGTNTLGNQSFNGSIANFRLFNRALSADEVWQLYAYQKEYFDVSPDVVTFKGGRLGIGTSEPRAVLDVRGNIMADAYYGLSDSTVAYKYFDSDTVNYTFSNLNLTVGEAYKIIWSYHNTTANHHVHMFVNGDETDTNYWHAIQQVTSTFDSTGSTGNTAKMFSTGNNSDHIWVYDLRLTHDGYPMMMGHGHFSTPTSTMSTGANQSWRLGTWYHNAQTSVITSLKFDQTSSGSFGAGSYIRILKTL
jgi:hypothetical protein